MNPIKKLRCLKWNINYLPPFFPEPCKLLGPPPGETVFLLRRLLKKFARTPSLAAPGSAKYKKIRLF